jgi:hypothetical protein
MGLRVPLGPGLGMHEVSYIYERSPALISQLCSFLLILCLATFPSNSQAEPVPNEANCRMAITTALEELRRLPPDLTERDDRDRKKLLAELERLVETNRRQGISECRTWNQLMGKAFNQ